MAFNGTQTEWDNYLDYLFLATGHADPALVDLDDEHGNPVFPNLMSFEGWKEAEEEAYYEQQAEWRKEERGW